MQAVPLEKVIISLGTGVTDACKLPNGFRESNPGPLEEEPVLLSTEPSLQPTSCGFILLHMNGGGVLIPGKAPVLCCRTPGFGGLPRVSSGGAHLGLWSLVRLFRL